MTTPSEPWWANDPELVAIRRRTTEEFELEVERHECVGRDVPDPVVAEVFDDTCWHELAEARDNLARARERYDASVLKARTAGFSWGEISRVLSVSKQLLHRRFNTQKQG
jgi:DNA-directed RNA polymerase specialized sigma24 family protein